MSLLTKTSYKLPKKLLLLIGAVTLFSLIFGILQLTSNFSISQANTNNNLDVLTSTYFGGSGDDGIYGADIQSNGQIILAGKLSTNQNFGQTPINLNSASTGFIAKLSSNGQSVNGITRLGSIVADMEVNTSNNKIIVASDIGLFQLDSNGQNVLWQKNAGTFSTSSAIKSQGARVSVAQDGTVASLYSKTVQVFNDGGAQVGSFNVGGGFVEDIAIDSASETVAVVGFTQKDGGPCSQLQVAWLRGYDYLGNLKWTNYDWTHAQAAAANSSCADTRGHRISRGRDGKFYFAGESAGGNNIYRYEPKDLSLNANIVRFDQFNDPYNTASNHITFYSRIQPTTGQLEIGQYALSRLNSGAGNTITPAAITADESGNIYIGGASASRFADRSLQTINSVPIGGYGGGDGFLLIVPADMQTRTLMTTFTKAGNGYGPWAIATRQGLNVFAGDGPGGVNEILTFNSLQSNAQGGADGYFAVWGNANIIPPNCTNGATNPPSCNQCPVGQTLSNSQCQANSPLNTGSGRLYFQSSDRAAICYDAVTRANACFNRFQKFKDGPVYLIMDELRDSNSNLVTGGTCKFELVRTHRSYTTSNVLKTYNASITNGRCEAAFPPIDQTVNYYNVVSTAISTNLNYRSTEPLILVVGG